MSPTYVFERVERRGVKLVRCAGCGKGRAIQRQKTFGETLSPWNVVKAGERTGEPKMYDEIVESLRAKVAAWQAEPEYHPVCSAATS